MIMCLVAGLQSAPQVLYVVAGRTAVSNAALPEHLLCDTKSASGDGLSPLDQFTLHGRTCEDRRLSVPAGFTDPLHRTTLPGIELWSYTLLHQRTSVRAGVSRPFKQKNTGIHRRFSFYRKFTKCGYPALMSSSISYLEGSTCRTIPPRL